MVLYIFEDNQVTLENIVKVSREVGLETRPVTTLADGMHLIDEIREDDLVTLDSQFPNGGDGQTIANALRAGGSRCLIVWHSSISLPKEEQERLGIRSCKWPSLQWIANVRAFYDLWQQERSCFLHNGKVGSGVIQERLLMPFLILHLVLQLEEEDRAAFLQNLSEEERNCCREGAHLLEEQETLLNPETRNMFNAIGGKFPQTAELLVKETLLHFHEAYGNRIAQLLVGLANGQLAGTARDSSDVRGVELFLNIIEKKIIGCAEAVQSLRSLAHVIANALPRLNNLSSDPTLHLWELLRVELVRLEKGFANLDISLTKECLQIDMKPAFSKAMGQLEAIKNMSGSSDDQIRQQVHSLVSTLRQVSALTAQVV